MKLRILIKKYLVYRELVKKAEALFNETFYIDALGIYENLRYIEFVNDSPRRSRIIKEKIKECYMKLHEKEPENMIYMMKLVREMRG